MAVDYVPTTHAKFFAWQSDFYDRISEKLNSFKIDAAKLKDVTAAKSKYENAYQKASSPKAANSADRLERNEREAAYKKAIRAFVNENIRFNSSVGDYDRKYLGLTIPDATLTPAPVPTTHPVLSVDFSETRAHILHIKDSVKAGRGKPVGVKECEVWYQITEQQPTSASETHCAGSTSSGTMKIQFDLAQEGKKVWYCARWKNTRGIHGGWSRFVSAIIA